MVRYVQGKQKIGEMRHCTWENDSPKILRLKYEILSDFRNIHCKHQQGKALAFLEVLF